MSAVTVKRSKISGSDDQGSMGMILGLVFLLMILLQLVGFSGFKDWLEAIGFTSASTWAAIIVIVEALGALNFFRMNMSPPPMAKMVTMWAAVLTGLFWFTENVRLVSDGMASQFTSSGFFGKYLQQTPGWWTIIEATIFLFWILSSLGLSKED